MYNYIYNGTKRVLLIALGVFVTTTAYSQDTIIGNQEIIIDNLYKPTLTIKKRVSSYPEVEQQQEEKPVFEYSLKDIPVAETGAVDNIRPITPDIANASESQMGFLKASIGSNISPYLNLSVFQNSPNGNAIYGADLTHSSSLGKVTLNSNEKTDADGGSTSIGLKSIINLEKTTLLELRAGYNSLFNSYYGAIDSLSRTGSLNSGVSSYGEKQSLNTLYFNGTVKSLDSQEPKISYKLNLNIDGSSTKQDVKETIFLISGEISVPVNSFYIGGDISYERSSAKGDLLRHAVIGDDSLAVEGLTIPNSFITTEKASKSTFNIAPYVNFKTDNSTIKLGILLASTTTPESDITNSLISPIVDWRYSFAEDKLVLRAIATGSIQNSSYSSIIRENIWVEPDLIIAPSLTSGDYTGGLTYKPSSSLSLGLLFNFKSESDQHFYYLSEERDNSTDPDYIQNNNFKAAYSDITTTKLQFDLNWNSSRGDYVNVEAALFGYSGVETAWNRPNFTVKGDLYAHVTDKLSITGALNIIGEREGLILYNQDSDTDAINREYTIETTTDISIGAEYRLQKQLNTFLSIDNLLNNRSEIRTGYNSYGMEVRAGITLTF